jgi:predicted neuraminidase
MPGEEYAAQAVKPTDYPALIQGKNGDVYITYTWKRKSTAFRCVLLSQRPD